MTHPPGCGVYRQTTVWRRMDTSNEGGGGCKEQEWSRCTSLACQREEQGEADKTDDSEDAPFRTLMSKQKGRKNSYKCEHGGWSSVLIPLLPHTHISTRLPGCVARSRVVSARSSTRTVCLGTSERTHRNRASNVLRVVVERHSHYDVTTHQQNHAADAKLFRCNEGEHLRLAMPFVDTSVHASNTHLYHAFGQMNQSPITNHENERA